MNTNLVTKLATLLIAALFAIPAAGASGTAAEEEHHHECTLEDATITLVEALLGSEHGEEEEPGHEHCTLQEAAEHTLEDVLAQVPTLP